MRKFKYFLKRYFKKILRFIIIFGLLSSLLYVNCFGATFDTFSSFMAGSNSYGYVYNQFDSYEQEIVIDDMGDYDVIYITSSNAGFVNDLEPYWFGGVKLHYSYGPNYNVQYDQGDFLYLKHNIYMLTTQPPAIGGVLGEFDIDVDELKFTIITTNYNGVTSYTDVHGRDFVKTITYDSFNDGADDITYYNSCLIELEVKVPLPDNMNEIYGFEYNLPSVYSGNGMYINILPSNNGRVEFVVGDPSTMATYPNLDSPSINEEHALSTEIMNEAFSSFQTSLSIISNNRNDILGKPSLLNGIRGASYIIEDIIWRTEIESILWISLSLGLCVFVLNIGSTIVARFSKGE